MTVPYVYSFVPGVKFNIADVRFANLPAKYVQLPQPVGPAIYIRGRAQHPYLLDDVATAEQLNHYVHADVAPRGLLRCSTCDERLIFPVLFDGLAITFPWAPATGWSVCDPLYDSKQRPEVEQEVRCRVVCPHCNDQRLRLIQRIFRDGGRT